MATITTRAGKGSPLTNTELDANFTNLNTELSEKLPLTGGTLTGVLTGTSFNLITGLSSTTPVVAGTAAVGTGTTVARADHVHPAQTTISSGTLSGTTTIATGKVRAWTSTDTDIDGLISGSTSGLLLEGANSAHFTIGIKSNDLGDGFQVISKGTAVTSDTDPYTTLCFEVKADGKATATSFNLITGLSSTTPVVAGTAAVGTGTTVARADHVHPAQTTVSGNAGTVTNGVYTTDQVVTSRSTTVSTNTGDWNSYVTAGSYNVSGDGTWTGSTNGPINAYQYGQLVVYVNGNIITQHYYAHAITGNFSRTKFNAADWTVWQEVWTDQNLTNLNQLTNGPGYTTNTGTVTGVTATAPVTSSGGTAPVIAMPAATGAVDGYMTAAFATKLNGIATGATANTGTVTGVTATAPVTSSGGTAPVIAMPAATGAVDGYMTAAFATKLNGIATGATANTGTVTGVTATAPVTSSGGTAPVIAMPAATGAVDGYMTAAFATKLNGIATGATANTGTVTGVTATAPVTSSGGTAPVIAMPAATGAVDGYMTAAFATKLNGIATGATANTGTVTGVTATAPVTSSGGTAPVIAMPAATGAVDGYMTAAFATKLNGIATGATANTGTVTGVTATAPVTSSGGTAPVIAMPAATGAVDGYMTAAFATKLNGIATGATAFNPASPGAIGGTTASTGAFTTITATGNITAYSSDSRLKTNVVAIPDALQKVQQIGGYSFDWDLEKCKTVGFKPEQQHEHGVLAQEIQQVLPDVVVPAAFDSNYLTVRYERIVPLLIAAIKEQQQQYAQQQQRIDKLEAILLQLVGDNK